MFTLRLAAVGVVGLAAWVLLARKRRRCTGRERIAEMATQWRADLLHNVIPFWERHSIDAQFGGFFTALDEDGTLLDDSKFAWLQCRAVFMWSKLHNEFLGELDAAITDRWFAHAAAGASFLSKLKDATGRLYFAVSRDGAQPLHFQRKPFAAMFYCLASIEHSHTLMRRSADGAGGDEAAHWRTEAIRYFELFRGWLDRPEELGALPPPPERGSSSLAGVMCLAGLSEALMVGCPEGERERWLQYVVDAQVRVRCHYDPVRKVFRENAHCDRGVGDATPTGRLFNPGHSIEVAWFLLHLCELRRDEELVEMALDALEHSLAMGWDATYGGLYYMMDVCGKPLVDCTVTAEHKLWWPMSEALYGLMLAIERTADEARWLPWLERVHTHIYTHLCDAEGGGEWWGYLRRDNSVVRCPVIEPGS